MIPSMSSLYLNYPNEKIMVKRDMSKAVSDIPNLPFYIEEYMAILSLTRQWCH